MRRLNSQSDLSDLPAAVRSVVERCLQRWAESGVLYDPVLDEAVILVESGDTIDDLIGYSSSLVALRGDDGEPPFEWITDYGACFEAGMLIGEDGFSLIVIKAGGINTRLLKCCAELATPDPDET